MIGTIKVGSRFSFNLPTTLKVSSLDPSIISVTVQGTSVTVEAKRAGGTSITIEEPSEFSGTICLTVAS